MPTWAGLANVRFMDLQPAERLPDLLATADIHLLPQRADAADLVMPSKLTVVQTCGMVVPPEDPAALAQAVQTLAADPALRQRLGAAGYAYALAHLPPLRVPALRIALAELALGAVLARVLVSSGE